MRSWPVLFVVLIGCSGDEPAWIGENLPACDTTRAAYRIDSIEVPQDADDADLAGWDFDGDGTIDNQGGNLLAWVESNLGVDLQGAVEEALDADLVNVGVTIDQCADPDYALISLVQGVTVDRAFDPPRMLADEVTPYAAVANQAFPATALDGTTTFPVGQLIHPLADAWVDTTELVVEVDAIDDDTVTGRIRGLVDPAQTSDAVTLAVHNKILERNAELGPCTVEQCDDDTLASLFQLFDEDEDGEITLEELRGSDLVHTLLLPDVDDGYSIGVGFHASAVDLYLRSE